jgi:hypothetical protein
VIGNLKHGTTMGRFGKHPDQKEVISSMAGTQISISVKRKATKTIAKYNGCRSEAASGSKKGERGGMKHAVLASKWISKRVQIFGMDGHRRR